MIDLLVATHQLPLHNQHILITAPRQYAARLSTATIVQGGLPLLMPTIETCALASSSLLDHALHHLSRFTWIAFTSRTGIQAVAQRLQQLNLPLSVLHQCRVCAIGQDAQQLLDLGIQIDLIPPEPSPAGLMAALAQTPNVALQQILVPVPQVEGLPEPNVVPEFIAGLENLGLTVTRVPAYATRRLEADCYLHELAWIRQGRVDAIAFSSTAEISALLQMIDAKTIQQNCAIACFGPYTARNAERLGLSVDIVSQDFSSFNGFVDAIAQFFNSD